jgi:hypothetical protein
MLYTEDTRVAQNGDEKRVPWHVLDSLHRDMPTSDILKGNFTSIQHQINFLYNAAFKWQDETTTLIYQNNNRTRYPFNQDFLALKNVEIFSKMDFDKVVGLLHDNIVSMVCVPLSTINMWSIYISFLTPLPCFLGGHAKTKRNSMYCSKYVQF